MNTTKRIITTTFAILLVTYTFAQVSLGLKAGVNIANVTIPEVSLVNIPNVQANKSFTLGAVAEFVGEGGVGGEVVPWGRVGREGTAKC